MADYVLLNKQTTTQSAPTGATPPNVVARPVSQSNPNMPAPAQAFQADLTGIGTCSATVQVVATNDNMEDGSAVWANYGAPIQVNAASADVSPGVATAGGAQPFKHFAAYVTAISGTKAAVTLKMSA